MLGDAKSLWATASSMLGSAREKMAKTLESFDVMENHNNQMETLRSELEAYKKLLEDSQMQHFELSKHTRMVMSEKDAEITVLRSVQSGGNASGATTNTVDPLTFSAMLEVEKFKTEREALDMSLELAETRLRESIRERNDYQVDASRYRETRERLENLQSEHEKLRIEFDSQNKLKTETVENLVSEYSQLASEFELSTARDTARITELQRSNDRLTTKQRAMEESISDLADRSSAISAKGAGGSIGDADSTKELQEARKQLVALEAQLKANKVEMIALQEQAAAAATGASLPVPPVPQPQQVVPEATKSLSADVEAELASLRSDKVRLAEASQSLLTKLRDAQKEIQEHRAASEAESANVVTLKEAAAEATKSADHAQATCKALEQELAKAQASVAALSAETAQTGAQAAEASSRGQAAEVELGELRERGRILDEQLALAKDAQLLAEKSLTEAEKKHAAGMGEINAKWEATLVEAVSRHATAMSEVEATSLASMKEAQSMHASALFEAAEKHASATAELVKKHAVELSEAEAKHTAALSAAAEKHASALADSEAQHTAAMNEAEAKHLSALAEATEKHASALANEQASHAAAMAAEINKHAEQISTLKDEHEQACTRLRDTLEADAVSRVEACQSAADLVIAAAQKERDQAISDQKNVEVRYEVKMKAALDAAEAKFKVDLQQYVEMYTAERQRRRAIHNKLLELQGNIRVVCRVRPVLDVERKHATGDDVDVTEIPSEGEVIVTRDPSTKTKFEYDRVFAPGSTQPSVFEYVQPLAISVLDGYNVCIFAYGQTGSGKTHTMEGSIADPGVSPRAVRELFRLVAESPSEWNYSLKFSMLEVYNEQILDLLSPSAGDSKGERERLDVRQTPDGKGVVVSGLLEVAVDSSEQVEGLMAQGQSNRAVGAHDMNEHSSRSHSILTITVKGKNSLDGTVTNGKLNLIDLAGSERISKTDATGERLKEAQNINRSLSALGDVIAALGNKKNTHVPYRNSKLTYLLQDSLGGNSKVFMFCNISPAVFNLGETICSLNFASRCRAVELGAAKKNASSSSSGPGPAVGADSTKAKGAIK